MFLRNTTNFIKNTRTANGNICFLTKKNFLSTYEIQVITGDKRGASTNSNVFVSLFDNKNNEFEVPIDPNATFERNGSTFLLLENSEIESLNDISKVRVGQIMSM